MRPWLTALPCLLALCCHSGCQEESGDVETAPSAAANIASEDRLRPAPTDGVELQRIREEAHVVLLEHCGSCHTDDSPEANPGALGIFNLHDPDWHARFDLAKLQSAKGRVDVQGTDDDKRAFDAFVAAESALRQ